MYVVVPSLCFLVARGVSSDRGSHYSPHHNANDDASTIPVRQIAQGTDTDRQSVCPVDGRNNSPLKKGFIRNRIKNI